MIDRTSTNIVTGDHGENEPPKLVRRYYTMSQALLLPRLGFDINFGKNYKQLLLLAKDLVKKE